MGEFKNFINEKILSEQKQVSGNLLKNLIDIIRDFVHSEYETLSDDIKNQIINNMKISIEDSDNGSKFVASSHYVEGEGEKTPIDITIDITSTYSGGQEETPAETNPEEVIDDTAVDPEAEAEKDTKEEVEETFTEFKNNKLKLDK
jgi:hypothetical protein